MPQCCPQSPLNYLYPGRPMEQDFSYTRDNIPLIPPITKEMKPQIPYNYPLPFKGPEPQKMSAVDPDLRFASPGEWWNVPRGNFPGETLPKTDEYLMAQTAQSDSVAPPRENYPNAKGNNYSNTKIGVILLSLVIISFLLIS